VIVAVGLFAVGEALHMAAKLRKVDDEELLDPDQAAEFGKGAIEGLPGPRRPTTRRSRGRSSRC
jgi:TctA family transporter